MPQATEMIKGIEVAVGVEVTASGSKALKSRISALRARYPFIVVRAATEEINPGGHLKTPMWTFSYIPAKSGALWALPQRERLS